MMMPQPEMILTRKNNLSFMRFPNLARFPEIWHGIFTRHGGVSPPPFDSLNTAVSVGDDTENVRRNRSLISEVIGKGELVFAKQVHGNEVIVLSKDRKKSDSVMVGDAMITDIAGKYMVIRTADCQPVFLYDPVRGVVGNVHSGWRGSISNIIGRTVSGMSDHFGSDPLDMVAGIGPSLGPCCAEFVNYRREIPETYRKYKDETDHFDFWAISTAQLLDAGLPMRNIHVSRICTKCRTDLFFSYRGEKTTGRGAAVIGKAG